MQCKNCGDELLSSDAIILKHWHGYSLCDKKDANGNYTHAEPKEKNI